MQKTRKQISTLNKQASKQASKQTNKQTNAENSKHMQQKIKTN